MKVRIPTVGPILGETTTSSARLFVRGEFERVDGRPRKCHGVGRMRKSSSASFGREKYFKLNPNFDMTGVGIFDGLSANASYVYQLGWVFSDVDSNQISVAKALEWKDIPEVSFRTASASDRASRSLVVGSCRYLLRLFGGSWFDDRGDKTFRSILRQIEKDDVRTDQIIMVGDQIYADDLNILAPDAALDEFNRRYREAFGQEHIQKLMARTPTYMTLDDHEIEDNWPENASDKDLVCKFPAAMHAYQTYQMSHSPLMPVKDGRLIGTPDYLWYSYTDGCADFFVMDTRTERRLDPAERRMIGPEQMDALRDWLADGSGRVKFMLSAVPLFGSNSADKWHGFRDQRDEILDHMVREGISRAVVLSGDVHASYSSELVVPGNDKFKLVSIVSSAFFWPYPHPPRGSFQASGPIETDSRHAYTIRNASKIHPTDNFARVDVDRSSVRVDVYGRKGDRLSRKTHRF